MKSGRLRLMIMMGMAGILGGALAGEARLATTAGGQAKATAAQEKGQAAGVKIDNFSFTPQEITVAAGTKVIWANGDDIPHTVVSTDGVFKSKALDTDDQYSFTFEKAGTYDYFCSIHPKMTGKVIVK